MNKAKIILIDLKYFLENNMLRFVYSTCFQLPMPNKDLIKNQRRNAAALNETFLNKSHHKNVLIYTLI